MAAGVLSLANAETYSKATAVSAFVAASTRAFSAAVVPMEANVMMAYGRTVELPSWAAITGICASFAQSRNSLRTVHLALSSCIFSAKPSARACAMTSRFVGALATSAVRAYVALVFSVELELCSNSRSLATVAAPPFSSSAATRWPSAGDGRFKPCARFLTLSSCANRTLAIRLTIINVFFMMVFLPLPFRGCH